MISNSTVTTSIRILKPLMWLAGLSCCIGNIACADAEVASPESGVLLPGSEVGSPELDVLLRDAHMTAVIAPDPSVGFDVTVTCTNRGTAAGEVTITDLGFSFKDDGGRWLGTEEAFAKNSGPIAPGGTIEIPYSTGVFGEGTPALDCSWAPAEVTLLLKLNIDGVAAVQKVVADYDCTDEYEN